MSKAKKIISMLLAVVMVLTAAPLSLVATAAVEGISYQDATFSGGSGSFTVDTSATTEVVRVAYDTGMFTLGNTIVAATRSGIPWTDGTYANVAYAGETPETPMLVITINGVEPDATPTKSCSVGSVGFGDCVTTSSGSTYTYAWPLTGSATAHSDLVFTITYKVAGSTYTAYAYSHVENILIMNGVVSVRNNDDGTNGHTRDSSIVQVQSHNMYASMCQDSTVSNREVGFINYGTAEALNGGSLLGCGSEDDLNGSINAYGATVDVGLQGTKIGSLIKVYKKTTGTQRNCIYNNDSNRGESQVYLDKRTDTSLEAINLRVTLQNAESSDFQNLKFETFGIYHGHKTYGDEDANSSLTGNATSSVIAVKTNAATGSDTITSNAPYGHVMTTIKGSGPSSSNTETFNSSKGEYEYSFVFGLYSWGSKTNRTAVGYNIDFVIYDTTDLYKVITGIQNGTGSYSCVNTSGSVTFNKGANPQAGMYISNPTAWENFLTSYHKASALLREPDIGASWTLTNNAYVDQTLNKSTTAQDEINAAVADLISKYNALPTYYAQVDAYVNHVYKDADGNETLLGQQTYADKAAGSTIIARYATIPGYEVIDSAPQSKLLSGANASETVTFYYQPAARQLVLITNNDEGSVETIEQRAGQTVSFSSLPYGTKADYDFSHWTDPDGNVISGDFTMPNANYTLIGNWIPSQIAISCIPVIDGVEHTDLTETYSSIRPNADGSATPMARPADLSIEGYIFVEYYADKELTTLMTWPKNFYLHDALEYTFYARMVDVNGKIIYESNGGSACEDSTFVPGQAVTPPTPTKTGYTFAGWYKDKNFNQPVDWSVAMPDMTGFIAYAKWEANDYTISFDVGENTTKYDTKEVRAISGAADSVIPADQYPEVPLKFGYLFDGWMLNGKRYEFKEGVTTYPTENITLEAIWRATQYSAFADIEAYEKLSGEYVETDSAYAGDIVTFRMSTQTNFATGSSVFVFMYDSNFFELVEEGAAAFAVNENSEYISGIDAKIQGVTDDAALPWPEGLARTETKADGSSAYYKAMMVAIDPTISAGNTNCEPMSDGEWIVEFKLKVKEDATGSGKVFMDNAWTRNQDNIMGTMFYGWAEDSTVSVADTYNNVVTPVLQDATATITLNEEVPAESTITVVANGGSWTDGTEKTFSGRVETEIEGYVAPTREGYSLTVDENGKTVWYKVNADQSFDTSDTWAEGYYGKEAQNGLKYAAQWTANPYDINFYVDGELKKVETVGYNEPLADIIYTPAAKQGYVFDYWADAEGNEVDLSTMNCPLGGMDVYAVWGPATDTPFKITANYVIPSTGETRSTSANYTGTTGYTVVIDKAENIPEPPAANTIYITLDMLPTVQSGNFIYDEANNTLPISGVIAADGSLVLDVNYIGKPVAFTFNANGGEWEDGSTSYVETKTFQSISEGPAINPTKAGYDFAGWNGNYAAGTTIMAANRTFAAQWTAKKYPATFNAVNSTYSGAFSDGSTTTTLEFEFGKAITAPADPSLAGYRFLGWASTDNATAAETFGTMDDENGKTYYAVYAPIEYTVTYTITCGADSETVSDGPFYNGDVVTLREPIEITGYTFDGWMINGAPAGDTVTINASNVEVTGNYTAMSVPVYFNANGGFFDGDASIKEKTVEYEYATAISKPALTPARAGYEFLGWAATADAESALTSLGTVDTVSEEIRFYAVWKATYAAYTINVYMQDTTGAYPTTPDQVIDTNTGLVGTEVTYTPAEKTGFALDTANSVLAGTVVGDGSLVLTVKYIRNKYEVKWLDYDGSTIRTDSVYYGAALSAPDAAREGYEFAGWTPSVASAMPANALEYTATYEVNYYDAIFNANGGQFADGNATKTVSTAYGAGVNPQEIPTKEGHALAGWAYEGTTDVVVSPDGTTTVNMIVDGLKFDAVWTVQKYSLSYRNYNNTEFQTFEVEYGTPAAEMPVPDADPVRTGYYFNGWTGIPETMPASQVRVTPDFQLETYTLKFNTDGGSEIADATVTYNQKYTAPANPTKTGYTFAGWDNAIPTTIGDLGDNGAVVTYTAQWTINQYTITFANTGDTTIADIKQDYNTAVTAPANPTKTGYTFAGWDKTVPATMPAEDMTITAQWTINQYTITFANTGDTTIADIKQDYNTAVTAPANPTKTGYTFTGWDKTVPATMPAEDMTITAQWTINQYTITFANTGDTTIADIKQDYNTAVTAPANPTKAGYTFAGWDKTIPETMPAEDMTITASWTINAYSITWVIDGETFKTEENVEYGTAITAPVPTKTGYVFSGWAEQIPATMPDNALVFTGSWNPAADTKYTVNIHTMGTDGNYVTDANELAGTTESTVYAQYTVAEGFELGANSVTEGVVAADGSLVLNVYLNRKTVTITFNSNGGSDVAAITGLYGAAVTTPANPTREGYTFTGWDAVIPSTIPAADVTITASWEINSYTVKFLDAEDGIFYSAELEYNAEIAAPAGEPAKANYTFEGWSLTKITEILNPEDLADVALIDFENAAPTVPVDGLTIYPVFVRVPVALVLADGSTAKIIESEDDGTIVVGYIAGLETRLDEDTLRNGYVAVEGDGRIEVTLTKFDICGTGTEVKVIDNVTDEVVGIYYLVIYGDVNGDADVDAADVAMIQEEAIGITLWSAESSDTYDRSKVLAADMNKDGRIKTVDAECLTEVTLFLAEIDQQTGDIISYI